MQGTKLGTVAHLIGLRRTGIGNVSVDDAWHLDELVETVQSRRWGHVTDAVERLAEGSSHGHALTSRPQLDTDAPAGSSKLSSVDSIRSMGDMPSRKGGEQNQDSNCLTKSTHTS